MWTGTKFCKLKAYILSKNVTPEFLQLEHCCCLSHQFSCHVCCGTIFDNNLTSVLHCSDEMITDITLLRSLSIYDLERLVHTGHLNNWVRSKPSYTAADSAMYSAAQDDSATVGCFFDFQEIRRPVLFRLKQYPCTGTSRVMCRWRPVSITITNQS